jgi:hypothetical protein
MYVKIKFMHDDKCAYMLAIPDQEEVTQEIVERAFKGYQTELERVRRKNEA